MLKLLSKNYDLIPQIFGSRLVFFNADGETRTRKAKPHAPQACAYTNSATSAKAHNPVL